MGLLSLAIWLPLASGVLLLALGRDEHAGTARWVALIASLASFLVTLPLVSGFDSGTAFTQTALLRTRGRRIQTTISQYRISESEHPAGSSRLGRGAFD